ncbi:MAG: putative LPS assembly protein LptD, partial [Calditrichia bacterium]
GNVKIEYQNITLTAGKVIIDWNNNTMRAMGIADSTDSLGNPVYKDFPVLTEQGTEPIKGEILEYNFNTKRGKVFEGRTKMEPGYYNGREIVKFGKESLLIRGGCFTTCDIEDHPHYYFCSSKIRVRLNKRAVAQPIIFYIADVPIFPLPFGVFPLEKGRRSGLIVPKFGENASTGRYLEEFGYYWAASQYWDATFLLSFYEKTGLLYRGEIRYARRYKFNGNFNGSYAPKDVLTGEKKERWDFNFSHQHTFSPTARFSASGSFRSDKDFTKDYFTDIEKRLDQNLLVNALFTKSWTKSRNSLTLSVRRNENLQSGQLDYELPNLIFSMPSKSLIPVKPGAGNKDAWYTRTKINYNTNFLSKGSRVAGESEGDLESSLKTAWQHRIGLTAPQKVFKYFNLNLNANLQELWVPEYLNYTFVDSLNDAVKDTVKEFRARHIFDVGVNARTTFYGIWSMPISPLKVIRHKVDPSVGFTFTPDFSDPRYGNYQTFTDTSGKEIKKDRFAETLFAGTPRGGRKSMNFALSNLFQGKIISEGKERKIDLFRLNFATSHNFNADSLKWSDLTTNFNASPIQNLTVVMGARHTFYKPTSDGTGKRNEFVWQGANPQFLRLLNWNIRLNSRIHLKAPEPQREKATPIDTLTTEDSLRILQQEQEDITRRNTLDEIRGFKAPWDVNMNFNYSYTWNEINRGSEQFNVNVDARIQLTKNWRIQYFVNLNILDKNIEYQRFIIYRDLHCWEMSVEWAPNPGFDYYRLEIRIKDQFLRDLKLTRTASGGPIY